MSDAGHAAAAGTIATNVADAAAGAVAAGAVTPYTTVRATTGLPPFTPAVAA